MSINKTREAKAALEQEIYKLIDEFELKSDFIVETVALTHRHIEAGIGSRDALDKVMVRIVMP
jgi:hypothetical protein